MEKYVVTGGAVRSTARSRSAARKNAAVAIIPATVLATRHVCVIDNIPNISDVTASAQDPRRDLGATVRLLGKTTVEIDTTHLADPVAVPHDLAKPLRATYYFLGSLLGRCGRGRAYRCPAAATSAVRAPSTSTSRASRPWAPMRRDRTRAWSTPGRRAAPGRSTSTFDVVIGGRHHQRHAGGGAGPRASPAWKTWPRSPTSWTWPTFSTPWARTSAAPGTDVIKIHGVDVMHGTNYSIIPDQIEAGTYMVAAAGHRRRCAGEKCDPQAPGIHHRQAPQKAGRCR